MLDNTQQALEDFKKYVIQQARTNLTKGKKNVDKNLYNSLQGFVEKSPAGFRLYFEMEDYGMFQDQGVRGKKAYYADQATSGSPFSYKDKMPPIKPLAEWAKKRNIRLRDDKGKFKKGNYIFDNVSEEQYNDFIIRFMGSEWWLENNQIVLDKITKSNKGIYCKDGFIPNEDLEFNK